VGITQVTTYYSRGKPNSSPSFAVGLPGSFKCSTTPDFIIYVPQGSRALVQSEPKMFVMRVVNNEQQEEKI